MADLTNWKSAALNGLKTSCDIQLYDSTDTLVTTVTATFGVVNGNSWRATNVTFSSLPAGTIVKSVSIMDDDTLPYNPYVSDILLSGTSTDRTIGPAGGDLVLDLIEVALN